MTAIVDTRPITPKSNVFCSKTRDIASDTTYKNHFPQKLDIPAYTQTQRAAKNIRRTAGLPATKVHIFPSTHAPVSKSSYGFAFNKVVPNEPRDEPKLNRQHCHLKPSCTHCMYEAILNSHHFQERSHEKAILDQADADRLDQLKGTHFTFGNDKVKGVTMYKDFTSRANQPHTRIQMVSPPICAEVMPGLPSAASHPEGHRSSLQTDFTFFGATVNEKVHDKQTQRYDFIKTLHGFDSVGASIHAGTRDKLKSRSMIDYIHPLHMRANDVTTGVRRMPEDVPYHKTDTRNIWDLNQGHRGEVYMGTENRQNFSWLSSKAGMRFQRFYKGSVSDKIR